MSKVQDAAARGKRVRKTYWSSVSCRSPRDHDAVRSWFTPLADDLVPVSAEVLCDIDTEQEKKLRAVMQDDTGNQFLLTRSFGKRFSMSRKPLAKDERKHTNDSAQARAAALPHD